VRIPVNGAVEGNVVDIRHREIGILYASPNEILCFTDVRARSPSLASAPVSRNLVTDFYMVTELYMNSRSTRMMAVGPDKDFEGSGIRHCSCLVQRLQEWLGNSTVLHGDSEMP